MIHSILCSSNAKQTGQGTLSRPSLDDICSDLSLPSSSVHLPPPQLHAHLAVCASELDRALSPFFLRLQMNAAFRMPSLTSFTLLSFLKVTSRCPGVEETVGKQRLLGGLEKDQVSGEVNVSDSNIVSQKATPRSAGATQGRAS